MATTQVKKEDCVPLPQSGQFLRKDAALALARACLEFGKHLWLTDSWRSLEVQTKIFKERYVAGDHRGKPGYTTDYRVWNGVGYTRKSGTAAAAVPGTSNHGNGCAIDVSTARTAATPSYTSHVVFTSWNDPDRLKWLKIAAKYGWSDKEGKSVNELWHMTYYPENDQYRGK